MGRITLFGIDASPSVRTVLLTLRALSLPFDYVEISLFSRDELLQEFYEKHPEQRLPTLEDDDNNIYESHAINVYLVEKYAKCDDLYPKDLMKRVQVDQRLYFESGAVFFGAFRNAKPQTPNEEKTDADNFRTDDIINIYNIIEAFLEDQPYIAGDTLTIADFSFISSVTTFDAMISIDSSKYVKLAAWVEGMKQLPYYEETCAKGAEQVTEMVKKKNICTVS